MNDLRTTVAAIVTAGGLAVAVHFIQVAEAQQANLRQPDGQPAAAQSGQNRQPRGQQPADNGGKPSGEPGGAQASAGAIERRLMQMQVRMAEIEVQKAAEGNQQVAGTVPQQEVQRRQETLKLARQRMQQAQKSGGEQTSGSLREAMANAKLFENEWRSAVAANRSAENSVPTLEVERLKLQADMGRLQVARLRTAGQGQSAVGELQAQLEELRDEILSLRNRVEELEERAK